MLKQIESMRFYLQRSSINWKQVNTAEENVGLNDELLYNGAIAVAVVTVASGNTSQVW